MKAAKENRSTILIREIETYRAHCLFAEARKRAVELANIILENERLKNKKKLLMAVVDRIETIEEEAEAFTAVEKSNRLSNSERRWVRKVFSSAFEPGTDAAAYEGATALMVFGQFGAALTEFEVLLKSGDFRVPAAKNIVRCLLGIGSPKRAVARYRQWLKEDAFDPQQLEVIRVFLQRALTSRGFSVTLPKPKMPEPEPVEKAPVELTLDLLSVTVTVEESGSEKTRHSLEVNHQRGKTISLIIPGKEQELLQMLSPGRTLTDVMFESTDLTYYASCVVYGNSPIRVGEKKGDHTITLKLLDR